MKTSPKAPFKTVIVDNLGRLTKDWALFFGKLVEMLEAFGDEKVLTLENNQTTWTKFEQLDSGKESYVEIDFVIQRASAAAVYLVRYTLYCIWNPYNEQWTANDEKIELDFSSAATDTQIQLGSDGSLSYKTSNFTNPVTSRLFYRKRSLKAKHSLYSRLS
jgi:hypothetical protein